jgi:hypothetical protein
MKKTAIILSLMLALPITALRANGDDPEIFEEEVTEFTLNDIYYIKLRHIPPSEYTARKTASEHLRHKSYKAITDIAQAQKMLGKRFRKVEVQDYDKYNERKYTYNELEITFKDGAKKRLDADYSFVAYYPQLDILLFEGGHSSDQPFDLNNSNNAVTFTADYPYHIRIGNPHYHIVSPNRQLRINGFHDGQDCAMYFLEKWNKSKKKYEFVGYFNRSEEPVRNFCWTTNWFWTSNSKVLFSNGFSDEYARYYEMEIIEKQNKTNTR